MDQTLNEIQKGLNVMKFDVVIGNPHIKKKVLEIARKNHQFIINSWILLIPFLIRQC